MSELVRALEAQTTLDLIRTAAAVATGLVASSVLIGIARAYWNKSFGRYRAAERKIVRLAPHYRVEFFEKVLGPAATKRLIYEGRPTEEDGPKWAPIEWIWADPLFYVQAVTDEHGTVVRWSVTSRRKRFDPAFAVIGVTAVTKVKLNKRPLSSLGSAEDLQELQGSLGAHDWSYWERFYFGNPGMYKDYHQGINFAGWPPPGAERIGEIQDLVERKEWGDGRVQAFRAKVVPNTYGETGAGWYADPFELGPSSYSVRVLERRKKYQIDFSNRFWNLRAKLNEFLNLVVISTLTSVIRGSLSSSSRGRGRRPRPRSAGPARPFPKRECHSVPSSTRRNASLTLRRLSAGVTRTGPDPAHRAVAAHPLLQVDGASVVH
jgi:hypothetical protein